MGRRQTTHTLQSLMERAQAEGTCVLWTGYHAGGRVPTVMHQGKLWPVRKLVAHLAEREVPKGGYWGTTCGCPSCIAPGHVQWRDPTKHHDHMVGKMFSHPAKVAIRNAKLGRLRRKLSDEQTQDILQSNDSHVAAAKRHGVSVTTIKKYRAGQAGVTLGRNSWFSMLTMGNK